MNEVDLDRAADPGTGTTPRPGAPGTTESPPVAAGADGGAVPGAGDADCGPAADARTGPERRGRTQVTDHALDRLVRAAVSEVDGVEALSVSLDHDPASPRIAALMEVAVDRPDRLVDGLDELYAHVERRLAEMAGLQLGWLELDVSRIGHGRVAAPRVR